MSKPNRTVLRAVPKSVFSWDYRILSDGEEIARVSRSWFREDGRFTLAGDEFVIQREGVARGCWFLRSEEGLLASAEKRSAFRRAFEVTVKDRRLTLRAESVFRRGFVLMQGHREIGRIEPEGLLSRKGRIDLPADLPLPVQVFLAFLVVALWKRAAAAASSG